MASSEASSFLSAVKWGDEGYYLKEFTNKFKLPQVAKIIKGQYQSLGVPSLPSPTLNQIVFLSSAGVRLKVAAQCVKFKDAGRRMVPVGSKLAVPENYDGWFEILSEDGRAVRCMESVSELARRSPRSCLVRDAIKVFLPRPEDGDSVWDRTRTVSAGETLTVGKEVTVNSTGSSRSRTSGKYLRCVTSLGDIVYLPFDLRSRFSTIAGEDNISGVHTVRTLLCKRFPLMVRLVHGKPPVGVKSGSQFAPEMRLFSLIEEESLMAMPLLKDAPIVPLPPNAALKVLAPRNADFLTKLPEHSSLANRCRSLMHGISDCIQVCDVTSIREVRNVPPSPQYVYARRQAPIAYRTIPLIRRSISDPQGTNNSCRVLIERGMSTPAEQSFNNNNETVESSDSDDYRYDEIDQIYDYVRGFAPLPENIKNEFSSEDSVAKQQPISVPSISQPSQISSSAASQPVATSVSLGRSCDRKPPEPPPIETIPIRKVSVDTTGGTLSTHRITVSIVNRTPSSANKTKEIPYKIRKPAIADDHIYEKIDKRNNVKTLKAFENPTRTPLRSNSASKIYIQNGNNHNGSKFVVKGQPQRHQHHHSQHQTYQQRSSANNHSNNHKSRFLKHSKPSLTQKEGSACRNGKASKACRNNSNNNNNSNGGKAIVMSPLFHIRYKSLTDLMMDANNTLDSSNSGRRMNSSATSSTSKEENDFVENDEEDSNKRSSMRTRKLPRPKSLSNLLGDLAPRRKVDNYNYYNLVQNDLIKAPDLNNYKYVPTPDPSHYGKVGFGTAHTKKLGTLYL